MAAVSGVEVHRQYGWTRHRAWETALLVGCAAVFVYKLLRGFPGNQWDFRLYYYAAQGWTNGVNPYILGNLPKALDEGFFAFTYPPYALAFFWPFTFLPLQSAVLVFLALKFILLAWLVVTWSRVLGIRVTTPTWLLFLLFAYSSTIFVDFASGNIVTIEQWLVWIGMASLLKQRYAAFVTAIVAGALFKFTPIVLLVLCFSIPDRRRLQYLGAGIAAFAGILVSTYLVSPQLTVDFFRHVSSLDERGGNNPALLPLIRDAFDLINRSSAFFINPTLQTPAYALVVMGVLVGTWSLARHAIARSDNRLELMIHLVLLTFAVTAPRMKMYAYMIVIAPTYYVATHSTRLPVAVPLLLMASLTANSWMTRPEHAALIGSYSSWFIAVGAWALFIYELRSRARPVQRVRSG
jgi:hypothetical protein